MQAHGAHGRHVRADGDEAARGKGITAGGEPDPAAGGGEPVDGKDFTLTIAKIGVLSGGHDVAVGCKATADKEYGNTEEELKQLTRAPRRMAREYTWTICTW